MPGGVSESRARFESAWAELADGIQAGTGLRPRPAGMGLLVLGVAAGVALAWSGRVLWAELRRQGRRPDGPGAGRELGG